MGKIIGIDLGTTNSVVAIMEGKEPKVIANEEGGRLTPSVVAWDDKGEVLVGQIARRQAITNPENTVYSAKRFMGRRFEEVSEETKRVPYKVVRGPNGDAVFEIRGKKVTPPEVSAQACWASSSGPPRTTWARRSPRRSSPSRRTSTTAQRQATKDAGRSPASTSSASSTSRPRPRSPTASTRRRTSCIAVYDFGGGTFDISILEVGDNVVEVVSTNGDTHLGGDDIDLRIMDWLIAEFRKDSGIDVSKDKMVLQRLKEAAEKAKIELSSVQETEINLPFLTADASGPKHLQIKLSRAKLEQMIERPGRAHDRAVQEGAGRRRQEGRGHRRGRAGRWLDPHPDGAEAGEEVLRQGAAQGRQPGRGRRARRGGPGRRALGRRQGHAAPRRHPALAGHRDAGRRDDRAHPAQHHHPDQEDARPSRPRPTTRPRSRSTCSRASGPMASDNRMLGKFHLEGIPPAPRGVPQIEVTFDIDANGIVNVSAKDKATGKEQNITITASSGLSEKDIERMVKEAEEHEAEDKKRREAIEARNQLESLVFGVQKHFDENKDKIPEGERGELEAALKDAKDVAREEPRAQGGGGLQERLRAPAEGLAQDGRGAVPRGRGGERRRRRRGGPARRGGRAAAAARRAGGKRRRHRRRVHRRPEERT